MQKAIGIGDKGVTLVELLVVLAIIGILIIALGFSFTGWRAKYDAENDIKQMYVDFSTARTRTMQTKTIYFVSLPSSNEFKYTIYKDTNPAPDGDGQLQTTSDTIVIDKEIKNRVFPQVRNFGFNRGGIMFDSTGLITSPWWLYIEDPEGYELNSDFDCIELVSTQINMGKFNKDTMECEVR